MRTTTAGTLHELVSRARDDDNQAWSELIRRYNALLFWTARRCGLATEDAADAVQLTWLKCWEHLSQLNDVEHLASWLITICRRESIRLASRMLRDQPVEAIDRVADRAAAGGWPQATPSAEVDDRLELAWHTEVLRSAVATLPIRERRLVEILLEPDPMSYRQIGRRLGMPIGSIGPVRQRALHRLQIALRANGVATTTQQSASR
jgi:RNA polymerase sigma factor (sigma-70 family)